MCRLVGRLLDWQGIHWLLLLGRRFGWLGLLNGGGGGAGSRLRRGAGMRGVPRDGGLVEAAAGGGGYWARRIARWLRARVAVPRPFLPEEAEGVHQARFEGDSRPEALDRLIGRARSGNEDRPGGCDEFAAE